MGASLDKWTNRSDELGWLVMPVRADPFLIPISSIMKERLTALLSPWTGSGRRGRGDTVLWLQTRHFPCCCFTQLLELSVTAIGPQSPHSWSWLSSHCELTYCLPYCMGTLMSREDCIKKKKIFWPCCMTYGILVPVVQSVKNPPAMRETWVRSLGWEEPLEEGMVTHSSILAWRIPGTEEPGGLQSVGSQRVRHDWATNHSSH